jgi:hypothetical protein
MNQALRANFGTDAVVRSWPAVAPIEPGTFARGFSSDRLKAFKTRFVPSRESLAQRLSSFAMTAGLYAAIAVVARELSTANLTPILHALHLNGV